MIAGSSQNLAAPAAPTITQRVAGSNETAITGGGTHFSVVITALNYFGETAAGTATVDTPLTSGNVVDCTITAVPGAQQYNIYVSTNATAGTNAYLQVGTSVQSGVTYTGSQSSNSVGGVKFTIQGAVATSTNHAAPSTDTGTGGNNRMEGLIPTLSGLSSTGTGPYANVGFESQNVWKGGYINQNVGTHLSTNAIFTALDGLWENNGMNNVTPGVYRADPTEIVADGGDLMRLGQRHPFPGRGTQLPAQHLPGPAVRRKGRGCGGRVRQPGHQVHAEAHRAPLDVSGHGAADVLPAPADVEPRGQRVGDDLRTGLRECRVACDRRNVPVLHQDSVLAELKVARQGDLPWKTDPDRGSPAVQEGNPER